MISTKFSSFDSLAQFANIKENVIYNHFGIFNEEYFSITRRTEELKKEDTRLMKEKVIIENMLKRIVIYLEGNEAPSNLDALNKELDSMKSEYEEISESLNKVKLKLIHLRNEKIDLIKSIDELKKSSDIDLLQINSIKSDICPTCNQEVNRSELVIIKSNQVEDLFIMKEELESMLLEINRQLELNENEYKFHLEKRKKFNERISSNKKSVSNVLQHMGYIETRDNMLNELGEVDLSIELNVEELKRLKNLLKQYNEIKKKANDQYYQFLLLSKDYFGS